MNSDRIKELCKATAHPESRSVHQALLQVWNECGQENKGEIDILTDALKESEEALYRLMNVNDETVVENTSLRNSNKIFRSNNEEYIAERDRLRYLLKDCYEMKIFGHGLSDLHESSPLVKRINEAINHKEV